MAKKKTAKKRAKKRKYSKGASRKIGNVMREYKAGKLKGGKGKHPKVKSRKQAIAIAISEARAAGKRVPKRRKKRR